MEYEMPVTGTDIWYYYICPREVWLMKHQIAPDQEDEALELGRFLSETYYQRDKKELSIGHIVIDRIRQEEGELIIGEVKKSSSYSQSARMQLLYYLDTLKRAGIEAKGELLFPKERKKERIEWTEKARSELERAVADIRRIARMPVPPPPKKISFCGKCAYREYCWAEE
ncbi:CRISPR-associated protein Cas4 [Geobacillus sp. FSL K6-0789]|uniref:CRISPR-associated exonuclease Cas4 n=3 Tax=Geobacillus TaxID=129337 RepID=A0A087LBE4_GEOSE|nr:MULTISPECIES: CRISPR-associated protein Cas4 [Geobacillus]AUI36570.1 CRISPR-associated protein Cas4 [[Bacillus] caldolyticus]KAF6509408.1 CRISPR-associated RecB family exonuclease Cas4a [Geobacillus stearothermophilus]KFL14947.1 CRISPR-associated protein Cas4 [Geobacillus stearothermophilus]KFX32966.1 CRISPR-associated protein Cas4 [Geobacillus stearothermophilus]KMY60200.1 CRISPR-associated protein Cas4 [Geobacillus stearothermophilus]